MKSLRRPYKERSQAMVLVSIFKKIFFFLFSRFIYTKTFFQKKFSFNSWEQTIQNIIRNKCYLILATLFKKRYQSTPKINTGHSEEKSSLLFQK